jgi:LAS superfamily LD-carboxypeptidase LdcB
MEKQLLGRDQCHLVDFHNHKIHKDVKNDLQNLIDRANSVGHKLTLASSFRSFERQLSIWNEKATGKRVLLDSDSKPLDISKLSAKQKLFAILRWSAVPGFSRHHWGTDFDIYDSATIDETYKLRLDPEEYLTGPFTGLTNWLTENMQHFFRPYSTERGGVYPEPWHISHKTIAKRYFSMLSYDFFINSVKQMDIELKQALLENGDEVYHSYIINIDKESVIE